MATVIYPLGLQAIGSKLVDLSVGGDDIRAILVDTAAYTYSAAHDFLDDVPGGARIATSGALQNQSMTLGVFDADDITISTVSGATVEAIILYQHTGNEATSILLAYIDSGTGLPFTPNGGDVTIQWDAGANKIFKI